jgi:hypothetical protein
MDRRAAEVIAPMLVKATAEIAATVEVFRTHASDAQVREYAQAVGEAVVAIDALLRPIIVEYPDLHP